MDYTKLSLKECFDLACKMLGLEDVHTIAIGKLIDIVNGGYLAESDATNMAQIIYHDGFEVALYDADDEDYEEAYADESGYDPYMGCYTGDC